MKKKIDRLIEVAREKVKSKDEAQERAVFERMTDDQLRELAYGNPDDARIREILASVDGLCLLGGG